VAREDDQTKIEKRGDTAANRRGFPRSDFAYPAGIKLITRTFESASFTGYLRDISLSGAGLEIDDPYGRLNTIDVKSARVILTLNIPRQDKTHVLAYVRWMRKTGGTPRVKIGISFKNLDYEDLMVIEKLIGLKSKDHNMMWNLWEQYCR
jgi:hypothetical protein